MNWSGPAEFFAMGGYGVYVWGAYGIAAACMLLDPWLAARRHRRALDGQVDAQDDGFDDAASLKEEHA